ncbi:MAG: site-specific DNA-methyltransferase [Spirochaetia bacterium]|nr:site-specific DNA-methyltransferase [Spirochaetia bacterium]
MIDKIHNESCLDTMARMPDNFIDLTVTSPPYDNLRTYNGAIKGWGEDVWKDVLRELYRVTKEGGVVVWVVGDATIKGSETGTSFKQALFAKEVGFRLHDTMIYRKANRPPLNHPRYEQEFEYMFVFSKWRPKTVNLRTTKCINAGKINKGTMRNGGSDLLQKKHGSGTPYKETKPFGNIWSYAVGIEKDNKGVHPAVFPEQLANDHIISWSNEGDLVYDPFMGSGTTAKMAILNNRHWIGSEVSEEYCEIARKRVENVGKQIRIKEETHNAE